MGNVASRSIYDKSVPKTGPGLDTLAKNQGAFRETVGALPPKDVTIQDGAIMEIEEATLVVDTEGGAPADDLNVISDVISSTEKLHDGMLITLRAKDQARVVTVKNSASANGINTADGDDIVLSPYWELTLRLVGGKWYEVRGRSSALADAAMSAAAGAQSTANAAKAVTDTVTTTPTANAVPQADANGKIDPRWYGTPSRLFASFNTSEPDGLLCNGGAYSRTTYSRLFAITGTAFGAGNGSTTFNVPDYRDKTIQGARANLMAVLDAALPNATGYFTGCDLGSDGTSPTSGAFSIASDSSVHNGGSVGYNTEIYYKMSLHDSNAIYKDSATVQAPAIAANIFIKY